MTKQIVHDVIIVGGGLAGLTLAALMAAEGIDTVCVDREDPKKTLHENFDGRTTAISYGSQKVLKHAGAWDGLERISCPIETIHISDGGSPVLLEFDSSEVGGRTFGWIAENRAIRKVLYERIRKQEKAQHIAPATVRDFAVHDDYAEVLLSDGSSLHGRLVVGADGRFSFTREWMGIGTRDWSYRQRAVVFTAVHENPHDFIAVEDFRPEGPFAILPMTDDDQGRHRSSIVWTEHCREKDSAVHYAQDVFDAALNERFPARYGKTAQIEKRFSYPLTLVHAHDYIAPRMALVAEAAHGIHPIAGQGLNIGLRDLAVITELVAGALENGDDPGARSLLQEYQRRRRFDNMAMAGATDTLNRLFSNDVPPVRLARRAGLKMISRLPFAKQFFMNQAMGAAGILPGMIRDKEAA